MHGSKSQVAQTQAHSKAKLASDKRERGAWRLFEAAQRLFVAAQRPFAKATTWPCDGPRESKANDHARACAT